jgi:DNA polymerase III epsilon subunit-like protein
MSDLIVNYWPKHFRDLYGGVWPENYCAIDTETTGYNVRGQAGFRVECPDIVFEIGHCLVRDRQVVDRMSVLIDWTGRTYPPDRWLRERLHHLDGVMQRKFTYDRLRRDGVKPEEALGFYADFLRTLRERQVLMVTHNGYGFDEHALAGVFALSGVWPGFSFDGNWMLDTHAVERANQMLDHRAVHPVLGDTLRSYCTRVASLRRKGLHSNLDTHCYQKYDFAGRGVSRRDMHGAETDAYCLHLLMESYRGLLTPEPLALPGVRAAPRSRPLPPSVRRRGQRSR